VDNLVECWIVATRQKLKYALIPLGINIDEEEQKPKKERGPEPDKTALARYGIDYDSI